MIRLCISRRYAMTQWPAILAAVALSSPASADEVKPIEVDAPAHCTTNDGRSATLPVGLFLPTPVREKLDAEVQRLQAVEVKLGAENASLRESAGMPASIKALAIAGGIGLVVGIVAGAMLYDHLVTLRASTAH